MSVLIRRDNRELAPETSQPWEPEDDLLQDRKKVLTKNSVSQDLDIGISSLQNCKKAVNCLNQNKQTDRNSSCSVVFVTSNYISLGLKQRASKTYYGKIIILSPYPKLYRYDN